MTKFIIIMDRAWRAASGCQLYRGGPPWQAEQVSAARSRRLVIKRLFIILLAILGGLLLLVSLVLAVHLVLSLYAAGG